MRRFISAEHLVRTGVSSNFDFGPVAARNIACGISAARIQYVDIIAPRRRFEASGKILRFILGEYQD